MVKALEDVPTIKAIIHDFDPNYSWMKIMRSIISLRRDDCLFIGAALDTKVAVGAEHPLLGNKNDKAFKKKEKEKEKETKI